MRKSVYLDFKGYEGYHAYATNENGKAHGGASIWVRNGVPHIPLEVDTSLQAASVQIHYDQHKISVSSVYIHNNSTPTLQNYNHLKNQLPSPFIIHGDLNAHCESWGNRDNNSRGRTLERFINNNDDVAILNDGNPTYISPDGNGSVIDLALCHPDLLLDLEFRVMDDLSGSDHFPTILDFINTTPEEPIERWNFHKADWVKFRKLCIQHLIISEVLKKSDGVDHMKAFTDILIDIAKQCIPKYISKPKRSYPWFDDECRQVLRARKAAQRRFYRQPTTTNKIRYKELCAQARRTIRQAKKQSWAAYISKLNKFTPVKKNMGDGPEN